MPAFPAFSRPLLSLVLILGLASEPARAQRRPPPLPPTGPGRPAPPKVQVAPVAFPTDFHKLVGLAGGGPYDVVLVAVRSRLPFNPKNGGPSTTQEVCYAEALVPRNGDPGLKLLFYGVPLRVENDGSHPSNTYLRTQTNVWATATPTDQPDGPLWETLGGLNEPLAKYRSNAPGGAVYPYPHPHEFEPATVDQYVYNDERQHVYEFKISSDLTLQAKQRNLPTGFLRTAEPQDALFFLMAPKPKQILVFPVRPTRDGAYYRYTVPGKSFVYGGSGTPQREELYGVFRTYCWQSATVRHHVPGKAPQRWLLVTADERAALVSSR